MDRVAAFFSQKSLRRAIALAAFVGILYEFRHLAILFLFFVTFERSLGWLRRTIAKHAGISEKRALLLVLVGVLAVLGAVAWFGVGKSVRTYTTMQQAFPEKLAELRDHPLVARVQDEIGGTEKIVEQAKHYAGRALGAASAVGHFLIHLVMAFVLAVVFLLEEHEIHAFWSRSVEARSLTGTLARWFGHVADATVVTVQLQLIVAACNTVMTLPVLLLLRVPNPGALMILIFVSALVPVIGNIVSGVILSLLAYQQKGWLGVGVFVGLTAVLHKIESYYLNPRLTARHVKMPGFLLIVSLIACEHVFGFVGFFLSFPILFVAGRIRGEMIEEDAGAVNSVIVLNDSPEQIPSELERAPVPLRSVRASEPPKAT